MSPRWSQEDITATKHGIKSALARFDSGAERLAFILAKIRELRDSLTSQSRLECYVYIMSALVHHERFGGLTPKQIKNLLNLGFAVLRLQRINPETSRVAHVHGDLHAVYSQICFRAGDHWEAAWQVELAHRFAGEESVQRRELSQMTLAKQALRMGHLDITASTATALENSTTNIATRGRCRLMRVTAARLGAAFDLARELAKEVAQWPIPDRLAREFLWESLCCQVSLTQDLSPMLKAVDKGGSHHEPSYVLECALWCLALESRQWQDRVPKIHLFKRSKLIKSRHAQLFYNAIDTLVGCYDNSIALVIRQRKLGEHLVLLRRLLSLEVEVLYWLAAGRWLIRSKSETLGKLVIGEYRAMSYRLTDGRSSDCLNSGGSIVKDSASPNRPEDSQRSKKAS